MESIPICLYGTGCRSTKDCIRGSKCANIGNKGITQCILDVDSESKSNCIADFTLGCSDYEPFEPKSHRCCNSGFTCSDDAMSYCVPVSGPVYCSPSLQLITDPPVLTDHFTLILTRQKVKGSSKYQILVNGSVPGPAIHTVQGRRVSITVINLFSNETTLVHWHGQFQNQTGFFDGVEGLTQCPIMPTNFLNSMTYNFQPNDLAGTYWYHGNVT